MFHSKLRKHCFLPFQETEKQQGFFHHVCHHQQCYLCDWRQCESKKEFAITFNGEVIRQPINKSIKKISNNYKPLNNYKQDFHNSFYVWFSAQSFTGATCQIWLTLLNWRATKIKLLFLTKKDYRYEKFLKIYFTLLLNGGPDTLNHYTVGEHTECWKPPLEDIYQNLFSIKIWTTWNSGD